MLIRVGYELGFKVPAPVTMLLKLYLHPSVASQVRDPEQLTITPDAEVEEFQDRFGNRVGRLTLSAGSVPISSQAVVEQNMAPDPVNGPVGILLRPL